MPRTEQKPDNRKINRRSDQRRNPGGNAEPERETEDVAEAKQEREGDDDAHDHGDSLNDGSPV
ncbi:hypothetical protein Lesp02_31050 [Lentzea sp. NBRC 105346]|nr:hypothetical protein Lesp02_31050 [Lentzea sp. NBRC 105346]